MCTNRPVNWIQNSATFCRPSRKSFRIRSTMSTLRGGVAVLHLTPDNGPAAREHAVRTFGKECHSVVCIYEGEIHRESRENCGELFEGQVSSGQHDAILHCPLGMLGPGLRAVSLPRFYQAPA